MLAHARLIPARMPRADRHFPFLIHSSPAPLWCSASPRVDLRTLVSIRLGRIQEIESFLGSWEPVLAEEARRYARRGGPEEDLRAEGALALWEAALQYDPSRHRTAPEQYIRNHIHRRVRSAYGRAVGFGQPREIRLDLVMPLQATESGYSQADHSVDLSTAMAGLGTEEQKHLKEYLALASGGAGPDEAARMLSDGNGESFAAWKKRIERLRRKLRDRL